MDGLNESMTGSEIVFHDPVFCPNRSQAPINPSPDNSIPRFLHVRVAGSPGARYALLLRDWLRAEPSERDGYAGAGRQPVEEHRARADHAEAEEPWSTDVAWPRMQAWARRTGWVSPV